MHVKYKCHQHSWYPNLIYLKIDYLNKSTLFEQILMKILLCKIEVGVGAATSATLSVSRVRVRHYHSFTCSIIKLHTPLS